MAPIGGEAVVEVAARKTAMDETKKRDIQPVDYWVLQNLEKFDRLRRGKIKVPAGETRLDAEKTARDLGYEDPAYKQRMGG